MVDPDETECLSRHEQAIELWLELGDETELATARDGLGWALYVCGEKSRALHVFEQNLELARRLGHHALVSRSIAGVCQLLVATGEFERAEPLARELHASTRESEDVQNMVAADHYLSDCAMDRRDYAFAEEHRLRALETTLTNWGRDATDHRGPRSSVYRRRARTRRRRTSSRGSRRGEMERVRRVPCSTVSEAWRERDLVPARARLGEPRASAAFDEGRAMTWDEAIELALGKKSAS